MLYNFALLCFVKPKHTERIHRVLQLPLLEARFAASPCACPALPIMASLARARVAAVLRLALTLDNVKTVS